MLSQELADRDSLSLNIAHEQHLLCAVIEDAQDLCLLDQGERRIVVSFLPCVEQ